MVALFRAAVLTGPRNILITMPPQHGKSTSCDEYFPAWLLGTFPDRRVVLGSYSAEFAAHWGRRARRVMERWGPELWGRKVSGASNAADRWELDGYDGGMITAGLEGSISGRKADCLIIDDPHKNAEEAASEVMREKVDEFYKSVGLVRVSERGMKVVIHTRWHEDDLIGRLMQRAKEPGGEPWHIINLPAIAEEDEKWETGWTRKTGDILCPGLFSKETLLSRRTALGTYFWSALYQQRPVPAGGGVFKRTWLQPWRYSGRNNELVDLNGRVYPWSDLIAFITVDLAASIKQEADYTVIAAWAVNRAFPRDLILLDLDRRQIEGPDILPAIQRMMDRTGAVVAWVESTGFQLSIVQQGLREGMNLREFKPDKDKLARALAATPHMEAGHFWIPPAAPWLDTYVAEVIGFPKAKHDDMVDVTSHAVQIVREKLSLEVPEPPPSPAPHAEHLRDIMLDHDFSEVFHDKPPEP